jgi:phospho-N-acetylmuramoyl-pentapeptide-transferase
MDGMCAGNSAIIGVVLGHIGLCEQSHSICRISEYYVYTRFSGTCGVYVRIRRSTYRLPLVQCLSGSGVHGRYRLSDNRWYYSCRGNHYTQGNSCCRYFVAYSSLRVLSVIMQVWYYKLGKHRGIKQRIFKRTPIHDNFRTQQSQLDPECKYLFQKPKGAILESKITIRFWIITIILAALTIITLKIR